MQFNKLAKAQATNASLKKSRKKCSSTLSYKVNTETAEQVQVVCYSVKLKKSVTL